MHIIESFLTKNPCYNQGKKMTVKGLMLHSVGCAQPSAAFFVNAWNRPDFNRACVHAFIDGGGDIYQTLPWDMRAWHCGGSGNNTHIGVEMCEPAGIKYTTGASFTVTDLSDAQAVAKRTYESAVELFMMLCDKYGLDPRTAIISHSEGHRRGLASNHADPEHLWKGLKLPYTMDTFRQAVLSRMDNGKSTQDTPSESDIWAYFKAQGMNDYGVAGLMGNLQAESGLRFTNLQNSFEKCLSMDDQSYTAAVDSGSYDNFVKDKAGYGLAQWTFYTRKQALLDYARKKNVSIGDGQMQLDFLMEELKKNFPAVLYILKSATSIRQASDAVLLKFEKPKNQSEAVQIRRAAYGKIFYDQYAGKTAPVSAGVFRVRIDIDDLNIRKGPGRGFDRTGCTGQGVFTIVEEKDGWGRLKSGAGWICLAYTARI